MLFADSGILMRKRVTVSKSPFEGPFSGDALVGDCAKASMNLPNQFTSSRTDAFVLEGINTVPTQVILCGVVLGKLLPNLIL